MNKWLQLHYQLLRSQYCAKTCVLCHLKSRDEDICAGCLQDILKLKTPWHSCCQCGLILPEEMGNHGNLVYGGCLRKPKAYEAMWASFVYQVPLSSILHDFKFQKNIAWGQILGQWMLLSAPPWLANFKPDVVLPVPLSSQRLFERGFNQSLELALVLACHYQLKIAPKHWLSRHHRPMQSHLTAKKRQQNISQAFVINQDVRNCKVLLVDDVVTTTATITEIARNLKRMGASEVYIWALLHG